MASKIFFVNKPPGPTSHDIVNQVRKITGEKRVGHTGTLDPFAEGLLIVLVGREATKRQSEFIKLDKEYVATLYLGAETDTYDRTGNPVHHEYTHDRECIRDRGNETKYPIKRITIEETLKKFLGKVEQIPPAYSAIKIKGKKAYELARKGEEVNLKPRTIQIYDIAILDYTWPHLAIKVCCSSGTYIRALAHDIGKELACGAYLTKLVRTKIGPYKIEDAVSFDKIVKM